VTRIARKRRLYKKLVATLTGDFVKLVNLLGTDAPSDQPPELFGTMEAVSECLAFLPAFVASLISSTESGGDESARRRSAVEIVDKIWLLVKAELLEELTQ
jgi:hypothetical protein